MRRLLVLAISCLALAASAEAYPGVTTANVNFRDGPGTQNASLGVLSAGTTLDILDCDDGGIWCAVDVNGQTGYVSGNYLQETAAAVEEPAGADVVEPGGDDLGPDADLFSDDELDELVAPIALYPDSLLTQVLVAATVPLDIVKAQRFVEANKDMPPDQREAAADGEGWDESVAVLAAGFPEVIGMMAKDLDWTQDLGDAVLIQNDDVLDAVQRQRARAQAVGNLKTNEAQVVSTADNAISIAPAKPDVVYVPRYDPVVTYTTPAAAEPVYIETGNDYNYDTGALLATGAIAFGTGLAINSVFNDNWGYRDYWYRPRNIVWNENNIYPRPIRPGNNWNNRPGDRPGRPDWNGGRPGDRPGGRPDWNGRPGDRPGIGDRPGRPGARPDGPWRPDDRRRDAARRNIKADHARRDVANRADRPGANRPGANRPGGNRPAANRPAGAGGAVNRQSMENKLKARSGNPPKASRPAGGANRPAAARKTGPKSGAVSRPKSNAAQVKKASSRGKASAAHRSGASRAPSRPKQVHKPAARKQVQHRAPPKRSAFSGAGGGGHRASAHGSRGHASRGGGGRRGGGRRH